MSVLDELEGGALVGVAAVLGAALLAPVVVPPLFRAVRPVAKGMIWAGMTLYDRGRETLAEIQEMTEDMVAEVRAEARAAPAGRAGNGGGAPYAPSAAGTAYTQPAYPSTPGVRPVSPATESGEPRGEPPGTPGSMP